MSRLERRAESAELDLLKWRKLRYLSKRIGLEAQGLVTGVEEFGVFVLLVELGVDGLLPLDHLPEDHYELAEDRQFLVGARAGRRFQLGDNLRVRVHEISERRRRLVLSLPGEPRRRRDSQPGSRSGPRNRRQSQKNRPARKPRSSSGQGTRTRR